LTTVHPTNTNINWTYPKPTLNTTHILATSTTHIPIANTAHILIANTIHIHLTNTIHFYITISNSSNSTTIHLNLMNRLNVRVTRTNFIINIRTSILVSIMWRSIWTDRSRDKMYSLTRILRHLEISIWTSLEWISMILSKRMTRWIMIITKKR